MEKTYDPRIAEARRLARRMAREQGTPYQSELDAVARSAGATSWTEFMQAPAAITQPMITAPVATVDGEDDKTISMTKADKDLLLRTSVGMLGTVVTVVLGTGLLIASSFATPPWSTVIETAGTLFCAAGVLAVPSGMSGYVMGMPVGEPRHLMQLRWRVAMAVMQGWFVFGVARHLMIG